MPRMTNPETIERHAVKMFGCSYADAFRLKEIMETINEALIACVKACGGSKVQSHLTARIEKAVARISR